MRWCLLLCLVACGSPQPAPRPAPPPDQATIAPPPEQPGPACEPFDERNPACRSDPRMCTLGHADCKCPAPPDANNPACRATMPCPSPPDMNNPNCPSVTVIGRVIAIEGRFVTVGMGTAQGISPAWSATLVTHDAHDPLPGGEVRIVRVSRNSTVCEVGVNIDVHANPLVRFRRPASPESLLER